MLNKISYFNNAATTYPKPEEVYSYMDSYYRQYGLHWSVVKYRKQAIEETRNLVTELFIAQIKGCFVSSATEALNIILQGLSITNNFNIYVLLWT